MSLSEMHGDHNRARCTELQCESAPEPRPAMTRREQGAMMREAMRRKPAAERPSIKAVLPALPEPEHCRNCERDLDQCRCTGSDFVTWIDEAELHRLIQDTLTDTIARAVRPREVLAERVAARSALDAMAADLAVRVRRLLIRGTS